MSKRVKQVISALTARITEADRQFINKHLLSGEAALFWQMNLPDQRHALNVAYTALELAAKEQGIHEAVLIKCALLHDVGKVKGDVSTTDKIITVILDKVAPKWVRTWGRCGRGGKVANLRHAIYTYYHHAARGAAMLLAASVAEEIAGIVARHHEPPADGEPPELRLLRTADSLN